MTTSNLNISAVVLLALLLFNILCIPAADAGFGEWQLRNPSGTSIDIHALTYGKGRYVGYKGKPMVSNLHN